MKARKIVAPTKFTGERIAETCRKRFLTDPRSSVHVYDEYLLTDGEIWVSFFCTKNEWDEIEKFYGLEEVCPKYEHTNRYKLKID